MEEEEEKVLMKSGPGEPEAESRQIRWPIAAPFCSDVGSYRIVRIVPYSYCAGRAAYAFYALCLMLCQLCPCVGHTVSSLHCD